MKTTIENVSSVERKIVVEIEGARVAEQFSTVYRELGRRVKVEGFRPGKAPRHVLERKFKSQVEADVAEALVNQSFSELAREHSLQTVAPPRVTIDKLADGEGLTYTARVEVKPIIEVKGHTSMAFSRGKHAVADAEIDQELERLRKSEGERTPVLGREVAARGDLATIDFEATIDGKPFPGSSDTDTTIEVTEGEFVQGKVIQIEGLAVGAQRTIDYNFPPDFRIADAAGKASKITFTLKKLFETKLPALDDAFAEKVAGVKTVAELRTRVKEVLTVREDNEKSRETRVAIVRNLIAANSFECPKALIERGLDIMVRSGIDRMSQQGIDVEKMGLDVARLREDLRGQAEEEVRGGLLLEAVAKLEKIEATEGEFDQRLELIAKENHADLRQVQQLFRRPAERSDLMARLREEKTIAFIESKATVTEK